MATIEERLQIRRVPIDKWSVREQLCLASAVIRSGDQNWMSVSRALKPFAEPNRPPDWFSQKNCAAQYGSLLENVETPKRKKRLSGSETVVETPGESILKKLIQERKIELRKKMEEEKRDYLKLKDEMEYIRSGATSDVVIEKICNEIDEEEKQKEQDAVTHAQWLKQREERKLEVERAFRPVAKVSTPITGQKRKASESLDASSIESSDESTPAQETSKPALSPLLTSLLKTPSHVPNVTSSILHSAITQRGPAISPTIASLLNTSTSVPVSQSLQQLVSTAIRQEPAPIVITSVPPLVSFSKPDTSTPTVTFTTAITPTSTVTTTVKEEKEPLIKQIQVEESLLESSKIEQIKQITEPVISKKDEIKKEEVQEIKEEISGITTGKIEEEMTINAKKEEIELKNEVQVETIKNKTEQDQQDIYEFDSNSKTSNDEVVLKDSNEEVINDTHTSTNEEKLPQENSELVKAEINKETIIPIEVPLSCGKEIQSGFVEIIEVVAMEDEDSDKEMNKKVSEIKRDIIRHKKEKNAETETIYTQKENKSDEKPAQKETTVYDEYDFDDLKKPEGKPEEKSESELIADIDPPEISRKSTFTPEFSDSFYDDMSIEVTKQDKPGKAKRDYSRTRKKEEKDIEILLAVEKAVSLEENEVLEETSSEKDSQDSDKKSDSSKHKLKDNTERSNSPWTEEEEVLPKIRRRLSTTPATPSDSIPNSPASGTAIYDDDRDYRTWKKSVMLVYSRLAAHKCASLFLKPITDEQAPGYHSVVYRPMDLQTIRKNIENGVIRTTVEFQRDVMLMFSNALMYNKRQETVYEMARQMQTEGIQQIQILWAAQAQLEAPARRETRTSESGLKRKRQDDLIAKNKKRRDD